MTQLLSPLLENAMYAYTEFINVEPVTTLYGGLSHKNKFGLRLMKGFAQRGNFGIVYGDDTYFLQGSEVLDIIVYRGEYWLLVKISTPDGKIGVLLKTCDFCEYEQIHEYCLCSDTLYDGCNRQRLFGSPYIINTYGLNRIKQIPVGGELIIGNQGSITNVEQGTAEFAEYGPISYLILDAPITQLLVGDYINVYGEYIVNSGSIFKVMDIVGNKVYLNAPVAFVGDLVEAPINFIIGKEISAVIAIMTCNGVQYITKTMSNDYAIITSKTFTDCFNGMVQYTGANGAIYTAFLNSDKNNIQISNAQSIELFGDVQEIMGGATGITAFQNFIIYGGDRYIGASYISDNNGTPILNGNVLRTNLGLWINPDGGFEAYDEWENSFYFLGSNKKLYALSLGVDNSGRIQAKLEDMTDDDWAERVYQRLQALSPNDYVNIEADDNKFQIIVNRSQTHSRIPSNTTVYTFWKHKKIWTTHNLCDIVLLKTFKFDDVEIRYGKSGLYHRCGTYNSATSGGTTTLSPIKAEIKRLLFEEGNPVFGNLEGRNSFQEKKLNYIKLQRGARYKRDNVGAKLTIKAFKDDFQSKTEIGYYDEAEYFNLIDAINNGEDPEISSCMLNRLRTCEELKNEDGVNLPDMYYDRGGNCDCPIEKPYQDQCIVYDGLKKQYISPFTNLQTGLKSIQGNLYEMSVSFRDDMTFYGYMLDYDVLPINNSPKSQFVDCNGCILPEEPVLGNITLFEARDTDGNPYDCGNVVLVWNGVSNATQYTITEGPTTIYSGAGLTYTFPAKPTNGIHTYTLTATLGEQSVSSNINVNVQDCIFPPSTPTGLVITKPDGTPYDCGNIKINRDDMAGATSYEIREGLTLIATVASSEYTMPTMPSVGNHTYSIRACNVAGCSADATVSIDIVICQTGGTYDIVNSPVCVGTGFSNQLLFTNELNPGASTTGYSFVGSMVVKGYTQFALPGAGNVDVYIFKGPSGQGNTSHFLISGLPEGNGAYTEIAHFGPQGMGNGSVRNININTTSSAPCSASESYYVAIVNEDANTITYDCIDSGTITLTSL